MSLSLLTISIEVFLMPNAAPLLELDVWLSEFLSSNIYSRYPDLKFSDSENPWNVVLGSRSQPDLSSVRSRQRGSAKAGGGRQPVHGWVLVKDYLSPNVKNALVEKIEERMAAYLEQNQDQWTNIIIDDIESETFEGFEESDVRDYVELWRSYMTDHAGQKVEKAELLRMDIGRRLPSHLENLVLGWLIKTNEIVILPQNLNEAYFLRYDPNA